MRYRILKWDVTFENNRTRELKKLQWFPAPNEFDGDGYTELVAGPHGASNYGAWMGIVGVASRCDPRGILVRRDGSPHDPASISRITRLPIDCIERCWKLVISIGWLEDCKIPHDCAALGSHFSALEGKRMEKKGREEKAPPYAPPRGAVEAIYWAYPRKVAPAKAEQAIEKALRQIAKDPPEGQKPHEWLLIRTQKYASSKAGQKPAGDKDYRPHPATWFNQGRYDDDEREWEKANG